MVVVNMAMDALEWYTVQALSERLLELKFRDIAENYLVLHFQMTQTPLFPENYLVL
jgi:hypothetical protein